MMSFLITAMGMHEVFGPVITPNLLHLQARQ